VKPVSPDRFENLSQIGFDLPDVFLYRLETHIHPSLKVLYLRSEGVDLRFIKGPEC
jgi:hypothetical protein